MFLQCNRLEASETELQNQVDDLNDKIEELEEQIRRLQLTEKQLRAALIKTENSESQLTVQLDNAKGDVEVRYLLMWGGGIVNTKTGLRIFVVVIPKEA